LLYFWKEFQLSLFLFINSKELLAAYHKIKLQSSDFQLILSNFLIKLNELLFLIIFIYNNNENIDFFQGKTFFIEVLDKLGLFINKKVIL
jgi:hypothetical protein